MIEDTTNVVLHAAVLVLIYFTCVKILFVYVRGLGATFEYFG